jgi:hypothetical protein
MEGYSDQDSGMTATRVFDRKRPCAIVVWKYLNTMSSSGSGVVRTLPVETLYAPIARLILERSCSSGWGLPANLVLENPSSEGQIADAGVAETEKVW